MYIDTYISCTYIIDELEYTMDIDYHGIYPWHVYAVNSCSLSFV